MKVAQDIKTKTEVQKGKKEIKAPKGALCTGCMQYASMPDCERICPHNK